MTPSLGPINLLKQLTELRKTVYLLFTRLLQQNVIKEMMNVKMEKMCSVRCVGRGAELPHSLQTPLCAYQPGSSLSPVFLGFLWRLHHKGMIITNSLFSPFPHSGA